MDIFIRRLISLEVDCGHCTLGFINTSIFICTNALSFISTATLEFGLFLQSISHNTEGALIQVFFSQRCHIWHRSNLRTS
jgi:hypothetical protein